MKLIQLNQIPQEAQNEIQLLVGILEGKPLLVAKKQSEEEWIIYKNAGQSIIKKENLRKLGTLASMDDVLSYFQGKKVNIFCPNLNYNSVFSSTNSHKEAKKGKRRYYRKKSRLYGEYYNTRTKISGEFISEDVSFMGLNFITIDNHDIQVGDNLFVSFVLDNYSRSTIKREAEVKHVKKKQVGVMFINPPSYDKELGFYLS